MVEVLTAVLPMWVVTMAVVLVVFREIGQVWRSLAQHRDAMAEVARSVYYEERIKERLED